MATIYNYIRTFLDPGYDINHPARTDANGQILLAKEIEVALPGKLFIVRCNDLLCDIEFVEELTAGEKTTLDGIVADHQNNT